MKVLLHLGKTPLFYEQLTLFFAIQQFKMCTKKIVQSISFSDPVKLSLMAEAFLNAPLLNTSIYIKIISLKPFYYALMR